MSIVIINFIIIIINILMRPDSTGIWRYANHLLACLLTYLLTYKLHCIQKVFIPTIPLTWVMHTAVDWQDRYDNAPPYRAYILRRFFIARAKRQMDASDASGRVEYFESKSILIISSYTVSKLVHFSETQHHRVDVYLNFACLFVSLTLFLLLVYVICIRFSYLAAILINAFTY